MPTAQPTPAMPSDLMAALRTVRHSGGVLAPTVGSNSREIIVLTWGIARSDARGRTRVLPTSQPFSGPMSL